MYRVTTDKINANRYLLKKIHAKKRDYLEVIPLLDEPYQLALKILDYPGSDDKSIASELGVNWQTVKQIRKALEI